MPCPGCSPANSLNVFSGSEELLPEQSHGEVDVDCQDDQLGVHQGDRDLQVEELVGEQGQLANLGYIGCAGLTWPQKHNFVS